MVAKPDHGQIRVDESGARFGKQSRAQLTSSVKERMSLISAARRRPQLEDQGKSENKSQMWNREFERLQNATWFNWVFNSVKDNAAQKKQPALTGPITQLNPLFDAKSLYMVHSLKHAGCWLDQWYHFPFALISSAMGFVLLIVSSLLFTVLF